MLDALRKAAGTWVSKLLLLLLVASFAVWGISGNIAGGVGNAAFASGDSTVTATEYRLAYERQLNVLSQRTGTRLSRENAQSLGIDQMVSAELVAGVVLDEQARNMNIGLSRSRIAKLIGEDSTFHDAGGKYSEQVFQSVLQNAGMRPEDYLRNLEKVAIRQQVIEAVSDGMTVPETFMKAVALHERETRTVSYIVIPVSAAGAAPAPSDSETQKHFEDNKTEYRAPEYRKISYTRLAAEDIADPADISGEDARKDYDKHIDRYTSPEKRAVEQIVFASEEAAKAARAKINAGTTFEAVITGEGKTIEDVRLGSVTKSAISDPAVADAAFALSAGQTSQPVKGAFGHVLLRVTEIVPQVVKGFAEVEAEIKKELAVNDAKQQLFDVHDGVEDALGGGATLAEAAAKYKLKVETVEAIDRNAQRPDGSVVDTLPESQELLRQAFETEANVENLPISIGNGGFVWFNVDQITPSRDRPLAEVRDEVVAAWTQEKQATLLSAKAEELRKRLAGGEALDKIATELALTADVKRGLTRGGDDADFGEMGINAVFAGPQGHTGVTQAATGDAYILFKVDEAIEPAGVGPDSIPENEKSAVANAASNDLLDQFVVRLQGLYPVTVNQGVIDAAMRF